LTATAIAYRIGQPIPNPRPEVYELQLEDYVPAFRPNDFGIKELQFDPIVPKDAYITSGDAIQKALDIERRYLAVAEQALSLSRTSDDLKLRAKSAKLSETALLLVGRCRLMIKHLEDARGSNTFFETEWSQSHQLLCIPKNPRSRK